MQPVDDVRLVYKYNNSEGYSFGVLPDGTSTFEHFRGCEIKKEDINVLAYHYVKDAFDNYSIDKVGEVGSVVRRGIGTVEFKRPDVIAGEITEKILPSQVTYRSSIDIAARHRVALQRSASVIVIVDRVDGSWRLGTTHTARSGNRAFPESPTIIFATNAGCQLYVDLLAGALSHVADVEITRFPVKARAPRISQT